MAWDINRVVLVGRLANDIEMKSTRDGMSIAPFGLAVGGKPNQDGSDTVSFFDVTAFGKTADNCARFLKKGSQICVEGHLQQQRWNAQDGSKRSKVVVIAERIEFLSSPNGGKSDEGSGAPGYGPENYSGQSPQQMPDYGSNTFDSTPLDSGNDDFAPF